MIKHFYKITLLLLFILALISCSDDDKSSTEPEGTGEIDNALVGTWVLTKILAPIATTPDAVGISLTAVFNADGTMQLTTIDAEGTSINLGTWGTSNGNITITLEGIDPGTSPYTVDGNTATINGFPVEFQGSPVSASLEFTKLP